MDARTKLIARKLLQLRIYQEKGEGYQRLFQKVMRYRDPRFVPVRPYGSEGDRKNDGYTPPAGTYYQVYAPNDPTRNRTAVQAARKAAEDFEGLLEYWEDQTPVRDFRFVFNDSYNGSPPPLERALATIRNNHNIEARAFLAKDLEDEALLLPEDELMDVLNAPLPEPGILPSVDFTILREVITHILSSCKPNTLEGVLRAPDFEDKIRFNGLTRHVAALLQVASYQREAVADYFSRNSRFAKQELRNCLATLYQSSREEFLRKITLPEHLGDTIFFDLLTTITPGNTTGAAQQRAAQEGALVVMAFYFEACDIFEDPHAPA